MAKARAKTRKAIFDVGGFSTFERLVNGPLTAVGTLYEIEECLRAIVLHDEAVLEPMPLAANAVLSTGKNPEYVCSYKRDKLVSNVKLKVRCTEKLGDTASFRCEDENVLSGLAPISIVPVDSFGLFSSRDELERLPDLELSARLQVIVEIYSKAKPGAPQYETHLNFLRVVLGTIRDGGSVICKTGLAKVAVEAASGFPHQLFEHLDADWREFATQIQHAKVGPLVPPVLSIVSTRSATRDKIPNIVRDLRDEWAVPRSRVWNLVDELKTARTISHAREIDREFDEASKLFSPFIKGTNKFNPLQVLWELFAGCVGGVAGATLLGSSPIVGGITGMMGQAVRRVQQDVDFGPILFGRGAFGLARRVRREIDRVERDAFRALLSEKERNALQM